MKSQSTYTVNDDAEYIEACRVQSELGAKHKVIRQEIERLDQSLTADVVPEQRREDLIGSAMTLEPGVMEEKSRKVARRAILSAQLLQIEQALTAQADVVYIARRNAGYRAFARDDAGYIKAAEKLLAAVDAVIALNAEVDQVYRNLALRGCDEVQHALFPSPTTAHDVVRWREGLADSIEILKQTAKNHAPR